jgi:hypothetical protein
MGFSFPAKSVNPAMLGLIRAQHQVRRVVIALVLVYVVNDFGREQGTTDHLFHHHAMLVTPTALDVALARALGAVGVTDFFRELAADSPVVFGVAERTSRTGVAAILLTQVLGLSAGRERHATERTCLRRRLG